MSPHFFTQRNIENVIKQISVLIIIACAETLLLIAAMFDISAGSTMAFAGVVAVSISLRTGSPVLGVLMGIFVGMCIGFINGYVIAKFKVPPFIATLGMMTIARGAAFEYTGGYSLINIGDYRQVGQGEFLNIPIPILIMLVIVILSFIVLSRLKFGRHLYAIGGNEQAALVSGIKVNKKKILVFLMSGCYMGLGGAVLMGRLGSGIPTAATGYEFDAITAVIIGGTSLYGGVGNIPGTIAGAFIIGILNNILNLMKVSAYWQMMVKGVVLILAVLLDIKTKQARVEAIEGK
jgi:inositol transport system permease protein